jgi:hypothetical protein
MAHLIALQVLAHDQERILRWRLRGGADPHRLLHEGDHLVLADVGGEGLLGGGASVLARVRNLAAHEALGDEGDGVVRTDLACKPHASTVREHPGWWGRRGGAPPTARSVFFRCGVMAWLMYSKICSYSRPALRKTRGHGGWEARSEGAQILSPAPHGACVRGLQEVRRSCGGVMQRRRRDAVVVGVTTSSAQGFARGTEKKGTSDPSRTCPSLFPCGRRLAGCLQPLHASRWDNCVPFVPRRVPQSQLTMNPRTLLAHVLARNSYAVHGRTQLGCMLGWSLLHFCSISAPEFSRTWILQASERVCSQRTSVYEYMYMIVLAACSY